MQKQENYFFRGSPEHFLDKNAIWDRTPPHLHINCSLHVWGGSRVPNLQTEFNYLDSFKSYGNFSDFVVPTWSPSSSCHPHVVPIVPTSSPHHPHRPHIIPIAPEGPHVVSMVCGLRGLHMLSPVVHVVPTLSPSSPHHPHVIPIIPVVLTLSP